MESKKARSSGNGLIILKSFGLSAETDASK